MLLHLNQNLNEYFLNNIIPKNSLIVPMKIDKILIIGYSIYLKYSVIFY